MKGTLDIFWSSLTMLVLALIFTIGEMYVIATYSQFQIWAKTDKYKSMAYDIAEDVLANKKIATHHIVLYADKLDDYDEKIIPFIKLCDLDFSIYVTVDFNDRGIIHKNQWVMYSYDKNAEITKFSKPITYVDVPVMVLYQGTYNNKKMIFPGKMEVSIFENPYKKIVCHMEAVELSKNETFSIGCLNKTKDGLCQLNISKKYGETGPFHVCFDSNCKICEEVPEKVYNDLPIVNVPECNIVFSEKYYDFPGSGIMYINLTQTGFKLRVYKELGAANAGGG